MGRDCLDDRGNFISRSRFLDRDCLDSRCFFGRRGLVRCSFAFNRSSLDCRGFEVRLDHRLGDVQQTFGRGQHGLAALLFTTLLGIVVTDLALEHLRHGQRGQFSLELAILAGAQLVVEPAAFQSQNPDGLELVRDEIGDVPARDVGHQRLL
jgi:hypothetical protein